MKERIKASALLYAVTIALLVGMVLGSMVLLTHFRGLHAERWLVHERVASNARSASYAALYGDPTNDGFDLHVDLFGDGSDSAEVRITPWGGLDLIRSRAWHADQQATVTGYGGYQFRDDVVLDLARTAGPLHLCGDARLVGDVRVPMADVRRGHIEGRPFTGNELVHGRILRSGEEHGTIRINLAERVQKLCGGSPWEEENPIGLLQDGVYRTDLDGTDALPVLVFTGRTHLTGLDLRGPVIIRCNDSLSLDADNSMEMVIIQAPFITIDPGAMISAQCFASLGIAVGEGAELRFPSLLAVWRDDRRSDAARIILSENALVVGGVIAIDRSIRGRQEGSVSIASGSHIHGEVYAEGACRCKEINGTLTAREFTLRTPASVYRGHLLDGTIQGYGLDAPWGFGITNASNTRTILQWGKTEHRPRNG
ncbi:MAG: hypothetical protein IPH60_08575 [Flavobacteriales bacterium]|nr:hypothetical protein [Flavobacteriales bacterium]